MWFQVHCNRKQSDKSIKLRYIFLPLRIFPLNPGVYIFPKIIFFPPPFPKCYFFLQESTVQIRGEIYLFPTLSIRFCHNSTPYCFFFLVFLNIFKYTFYIFYQKMSQALLNPEINKQKFIAKQLMGTLY